MGLFASPLPAADVSADLVLRGGHVWAGKGLPPATAVAVQGDRIVAIGSDAATRPWISPRTRVVELEGRLVVPGFNDAHVRFLDGSFGLLSVDLRDAKDEDDFARRISEQAKKLPKGTWIQNGNWDHQRWPSRREPTRALIDAVTPDHPVFVNRLDGHMSLANSLALRLAGVTRETKDVHGGAIVRDERAEPTGLLKDNATELADEARFKALGVVASVQPSHCIDDMRFVEKHVGKSRLPDAYRWKAFLDLGVTLAFGTDWFVEPLDPRLGLYAAVTREFTEGGPAGGFEPQETISLEDALDAYTRGSAYAEFAEDRKGTLAPAKLADLVVFAADLFKIPPRDILTTPVDLTVVGGRVVFERKP